MNFKELCEKRYSCRSYDKERAVESDKLDYLMECALTAPSACNSQPYGIYCVTGKKSKEIAAAKSLNMNKFIDDCDTFIVITEGNYNAVAKFGSIVKDQDYRSVDIGIVTAQIVLAATEAGLATCILGLFDEDAIRKALDTKDRIRLVISVGYAKDEPKPKKRKNVIVRLKDEAAE